jgi:Tfp pilus assembly pilus retraction ATPase PilT
VRDKIRQGEDSQLPAIVSHCEEGMQDFTHALAELVRKEWVSLQNAMSYAPNREALDSTLKGVEVKAQTLVNRIRAAGGRS